ncbi:hypothetical protein HDU85_006604 [Gaertneriomyces sp. JEL0708]|nr:hypothetical protein HDU85_006604 [Gaertneriomyces sp. JEL0708]
MRAGYHSLVLLSSCRSVSRRSLQCPIPPRHSALIRSRLRLPSNAYSTSATATVSAHVDSNTTAAPTKTQQTKSSPAETAAGPTAYYNSRVLSGELRDDAHQRSTVAVLQSLYDTLQTYTPPPIRDIDTTSHAAVPLHKQDGRDDILSPDFAWIKESEENFLSKLFSKFRPAKKNDIAVTYGPRGLYLHGDVGTGKTMVMDLFYHTIQFDRKRRIHFHAFMQDLHRRIHHLRTQNGITYDPIPLIATELANEAWLLCFDELQVTDITDAMILRRLFDEVFKRGVVMVTTSNRHPDELYQNGIQRQSFLPAIELLKQRCLVHSLDSGIDYRKMDRERLQVYFHPLNRRTSLAIDSLFKKLANGHPIVPKTLHFLGRSLTIPHTCTTTASSNKTAHRIAKVDFATICGQPHSAADYLELVRAFDIIILTDIPRMTMFDRNEARRFITFIDTMYEEHTKLVVSAEVAVWELFNGEVQEVDAKRMQAHERMLMDDLKLAPEHLTSSIFTGAEEVFAFQRAVSRLIEMQSHQWLGDELKNALINE